MSIGFRKTNLVGKRYDRTLAFTGKPLNNVSIKKWNFSFRTKQFE